MKQSKAKDEELRRLARLEDICLPERPVHVREPEKKHHSKIKHDRHPTAKEIEELTGES